VSLPLNALYPVKTIAVFAAILIVVVRHRDQHPYARFGPANVVTSLRAALVSIAAGFIGEPEAPAIAVSAVLAAALATVLDGLDGWLARRTRMASAFGARYDMEVDALLIQVLAILVWEHGKAGVWIIASGLLRYLFVAAGLVWPWMRRRLTPTLRAKAICVVQIAGLLIALLPQVQPPASTIVAAVSLAALGYSFAIDTMWLWHRRNTSPIRNGECGMRNRNAD
jgi:phosphatidylglycerophosphate synthase